MKTSLLFTCLALSLASCVPLKPDGRHVELAEKQPPNSQFVGRVGKNMAGAGLLFYQSSYQAAVNGALNDAAAMGATHLVLDPNSRDPRFWGFSQHVQGNAYKAQR